MAQFRQCGRRTKLGVESDNVDTVDDHVKMVIGRDEKELGGEVHRCEVIE